MLHISLSNFKYQQCLYKIFLPMIDFEWVIHKFCIMDNVYLFSQNCTAIIKYFPNINFPVFTDIISIQCKNIENQEFIWRMGKIEHFVRLQ